MNFYDLVEQAAKNATSSAEIKPSQKNLHNVIAPYLENIDYQQVTTKLIDHPEIVDDPVLIAFPSWKTRLNPERFHGWRIFRRHRRADRTPKMRP